MSQFAREVLQLEEQALKVTLLAQTHDARDLSYGEAQPDCVSELRASVTGRARPCQARTAT